MLEKPSKEAKEKAIELIEEFNFTEPPIEIHDIAKKEGLSVYLAQFEDEDKNCSGFIDYEEKKIYINIEEYHLRRSFTLAHELGHHFLHRDWAESNDYKYLMRNSKQATDRKEREANIFAANLLVPEEMLKKYYQTHSIRQLSKLFLVSEAVIGIRIKECDLW